MKDAKSKTIDCMIKQCSNIDLAKAVLQYVTDGRNEALTIQVDDMSITIDVKDISSIMRCREDRDGEMERLTTKNDDGLAYFPECFEPPCSGGGCAIGDCGFLDAACTKLAEYEDTDLTPDEAARLQAKTKPLAVKCDRLKADMTIGNQTIKAGTGIVAHCPSCNTWVKKWQNYCDNCGQRLEWSDANG